MRRLSTIAILFAAAQISGQAQDSGDLAIAHVKRLSVSALDSRLPYRRFVSWFKEVVGPKAKITWEVNDCGEQTGGEADKDRDLPICAEVQANLPDQRIVVVRILAGTFKKGIAPQDVGIYAIFIEQEGEIRNVRHLSDLVVELGTAQ